MKKFVLTMILSSIPVMYASTAGAEDKPSPYPDCGIGAALFENDTGATISNVIWDLGTTALTSATASPETCEGFDMDAAAFIHKSYARLVEETAVGQGSHLDTLLSIVDLSDERKSDVVNALRVGMADIVSSQSYLEADRDEKATLFYYSLMDAIKV